MFAVYLPVVGKYFRRRKLWGLKLKRC
jgi:hypothetical protein